MAASVVSSEFFNANSVVRSPSGPWVPDLSFDPPRESILNPATDNAEPRTLQFTGGIAARVRADPLGVAGQTIGFSYSWTGCVISPSPTQPLEGSLTVLEKIGGNSFSAVVEFCGGAPGQITVERSGTLVLDSDASVMIQMFNKNVDTRSHETVWMSISKITLTLTLGGRPSAGNSSPSNPPNSNLPSPSGSQQLATGSPLSSPGSISPAPTRGSLGPSGTTFVAYSPSGVTIMAGVSSVQPVSPSPPSKINTPTIVSVSLSVIVGVLLIISLGILIVHRRKRQSRRTDDEKRRSYPRVKDELRPRPFAEPTPSNTTGNVSGQPQDTLVDSTRKRPLALAEAVARPPEQQGLVWPRDFKNPAFDSAWKLEEATSRPARVKR